MLVTVRCLRAWHEARHVRDDRHAAAETIICIFPHGSSFEALTSTTTSQIAQKIIDTYYTTIKTSHMHWLTSKFINFPWIEDFTHKTKYTIMVIIPFRFISFHQTENPATHMVQISYHIHELSYISYDYIKKFIKEINGEKPRGGWWPLSTLHAITHIL